MLRSISQCGVLATVALVFTACGQPSEKNADSTVMATAEVPDFERDALALPIADQGGPATVLAMPVDSSGIVGNLHVHVRLDHTYIGDLLIFLESPQGTRIRLHNREGGGTQNLNQLYGPTGKAIDLGPLMQQEVTGTWKVIVDDEASDDVGMLQYVKLSILKV